ncbi:hypothetical protein [uncultured Dokdonia sp.]|uniref:hypothetical protein n=1 Tax=uncultured Dokdonia sp. TaxID=575653 RepID=UPI002612CBFB|nr:hypothetical protein [uncultured Dokdonia sp.]
MGNKNHYDRYDKVEEELIQSINNHLFENGNTENISAIKALKAFYKHYQEVSLDELLSFKTEYPHFSTDSEFYYPDGDVFTHIGNTYHSIKGQNMSIYLRLAFERHFYWHFEHEVVELRLYMFYKPEEFSEEDKAFGQSKNENLLDLQKNKWFEKIKNDKPLDYKIDINFNA